MQIHITSRLICIKQKIKQKLTKKGIIIMNKKGLLTGLLALTILATPTMPAFAAGSTTITADRTSTISTTVKTYVSASGEVNANNSDAVMSVTIAWDNVDFIYDSTTQWDPEILDYVEVEGGWRNNGIANVTVTNRSNCKVDADVSFTKTNTNSIYQDVDASFDRDTARIDSAVDETAAPAENFVLTVTGTPETDKTTPVSDFGIITVKIAGYNYTSQATGGSQDGMDNDG